MSLIEAASLEENYYYGDIEPIIVTGSPFDVTNPERFSARIYIAPGLLGAILASVSYKQNLWTSFKTLPGIPLFIDINPGDTVRFVWTINPPVLSWHPI